MDVPAHVSLVNRGEEAMEHDYTIYEGIEGKKRARKESSVYEIEYVSGSGTMRNTRGMDSNHYLSAATNRQANRSQ